MRLQEKPLREACSCLWWPVRVQLHIIRALAAGCPWQRHNPVSCRRSALPAAGMVGHTWYPRQPAPGLWPGPGSPPAIGGRRPDMETERPHRTASLSPASSLAGEHRPHPTWEGEEIVERGALSPSVWASQAASPRGSERADHLPEITPLLRAEPGLQAGPAKSRAYTPLTAPGCALVRKQGLGMGGGEALLSVWRQAPPTLAASGQPTRTCAQGRGWHLVGGWPFLGNEAQLAVCRPYNVNNLFATKSGN